MTSGMDVFVRIQTDPIDTAATMARLPAAGAVASFVGAVRAEPGLQALRLEHYPGMTEREITRHIEAAGARWPLTAAAVVHRVGEIKPGETIVVVAVAAAHRREAFEACQFLIDHLKTKAPFWKEERLGSGSQWVAAKSSDEDATDRWN
jgi:molybdopterin synthase catalytic subunit